MKKHQWIINLVSLAALSATAQLTQPYQWSYSVQGQQPQGTTNFAFLGQFAEVNKDCLFTVEYSVRSAQTAVYGLFECDKGVIPVYDSIHNPKVIIKAMKAISR